MPQPVDVDTTPNQTLPVPIARPLPMAAPAPMPTPELYTRAPLDGWAIASAICGFTAFIPILSQIAGLVLGCIALVRMRRQRRNGRATRGAGYAWFGVSTSVLTLLGWAAMAAALLTVRHGLQDSTGALQQLHDLSQRPR
jgi:hypothetical protein